MNGKLFFALFFGILLSVNLAVQAEWVGVRDGQEPVPIILFADAPPLTRLAAEDLADTIAKISGARPEIIEGTPDPLPPSAIWVGYQDVLTSLFPETDFAFAHPEEILIEANDAHLVIAGRDRWDPAHYDVERRFYQFGNQDVEGFQWEYGTLNAVYTFIRDHLGVRWLWPGTDGTVIPENATIGIAPVQYRYHPQVRQRHSLLSSFKPYRNAGRPGHDGGDWARYQRIQRDSLYAPVQGHGFSDWWDRFGETHPEYFALQPDGSRSGFPSPGAAKICDSNPAVWAQWIADVEAHLAENPTRTVFSASANDSWASGHCICENCRAWDHPDGKPRNFHWQGMRQDYLALSDRQVTFANQLGRKLKARFPDRDYRVLILSYGLSRPVPVEAVPDDNVIIGGVANCFTSLNAVDRASSRDTTHLEQLMGWTEVAQHYIWRPNLGNPAGWQQGGPVDLSGMAERFRLVAERGIIGINLDNTWGHWATQGPLFYLMAHLTWNPRLSVDAVMDDYYEKGFGPAAASVKAYWALLEAIRNDMVEGGLSWAEAFSNERLETSATLLQAARAALEGADDAYGRRLAFVAAGLEFLRLQTENRALVTHLRETQGADTEALKRAWANWDAIADISRAHPSAVNRNYIRRPPGRFTPFYPNVPRPE